MPKRKPKPVVDGITFDSQDEVELYWWCVEARQIGLLTDFRYQFPTYQLSEAVKVEVPRVGKSGQPLKPGERTLFRETTYTSDFCLTFRQSSAIARCGLRHFKSQDVLIDVKPAFERVHARSRVFSLLQKWVYQMHGHYVQSVVPVELFAATWCPARAFLTSTGRLRNSKAYNGLRTLQQWERGQRCQATE